MITYGHLKMMTCIINLRKISQLLKKYLRVSFFLHEDLGPSLLAQPAHENKYQAKVVIVAIHTHQNLKRKKCT